MSRYAMTNISSDSYVTVNHATKTIAKSRLLLSSPFFIYYKVTTSLPFFAATASPSFLFLQSCHIPPFLCSDCIIFLFLGMSIFTHDHQLHWQFVLATIILCTIVR